LAPYASTFALVACLVGCGESGPPTFPVQGKLVFERGGEGSIQRLYNRQGAVEFQSVDKPDIRAYGSINEDGSFTLTSTDGADAWPGAVAGEHRGRLNLDDEIRDSVAPQFLDFEKSGIKITVPSEGEVVIKVWR
jgi:hypothetical protein